jgi:glycosyltransferase involved in cell wall biosynthesis
MKIGIIIATYRRLDGKSFEYLSRALESVKQQTYEDYKVYVIGDNYDNDEEFVYLCKSIIPEDKMYYKNNPVAPERSRYSLGSHELWCSGGVNARNYGIKIALEDGIDYICPLDHDDYWANNHLQLINTAITLKSADFIHTCSTYGNSILPNCPINSSIIERLPSPEGLIHSSVCINYKTIPLRYRDVYLETLHAVPADLDLWIRMANYIISNKLKSYLISELTCYHPTERC